ncbi:hypothetical protein FS837_009985 [Tulasnella sp. UAMH 9824]|nr:hypothetical protein FS837_009985 [Tulasnella sp. UAMH 9824]
MIKAPDPTTPVLLEPIYNDDDNQPIRRVRDILNDSTHVYEPPHNAATKLRRNLAKIESDRGGLSNVSIQDILSKPQEEKDEASPVKPDSDDDESTADEPFTAEKLIEMRTEISAKLQIADGELSLASDLLELLLTPPDPQWIPTKDTLVPGSLAATQVVQHSPALAVALPAVRAVNSQVIVGTKDGTFRHVSDIFQAAAERTSKAVEKGEKYWETAVRLRRGNWPLVAAPTRRGGDPRFQRPVASSDNYAKDFRIAYGLEHAPIKFRKTATASVADETRAGTISHLRINGPSKRLRVGLQTTAPDGTKCTGWANVPSEILASSLSGYNDELVMAQAASLESELYDEIVREAADLPTSSAKITEKRTIVDAAFDSVLVFEMVDSVEEAPISANEHGDLVRRNAAIANLVLHTLVILLIRSHRVAVRARAQRSRTALPNQGFPHQQLPTSLKQEPILGPIISLLQYDSFVTRLKTILGNIQKSFKAASVACDVDFSPVGDDIGEVLARSALFSGSDTSDSASGLSSLSEVRPTLETSLSALMHDRENFLKVNGEATIRVGHQHIIRLTFTSPAILTLHLPQATLDIYEEGQLERFLLAEVTRCLMERLREVGVATENEKNQTSSDHMNRTQWIVDGLEGTLVGDKADSRLQVKVMFNKSFAFTAIAVKSTAVAPGGPLSKREIFRYPPEVDESTPAALPALESWLVALL